MTNDELARSPLTPFAFSFTRSGTISIASATRTSYALQHDVMEESYVVTSLLPAIERGLRRVSGSLGMGRLGGERARRH